jgi:hypothetical protein
MARLILHIGQAKTGSTSIQHTLGANRDALETRGFVYPATRSIADRHHLVALLAFDRIGGSYSVVTRMGRNREAANARARREWDAAVAARQALPDHTAILSSEVLFRAMAEHEQLRMRDLLASIGDSIRVLAYLRSPGPHYLSIAQQLLKSHSTLVQPNTGRAIAVANAYAASIGVTCSFRVFDRKLLKHGDAVDDFLDWAGIPDSAGLSKVHDSNTTLSAEAMAVLARLSRPEAPRTPRERLEQRRIYDAVRRADRKLPDATRPVIRPEISEHLWRVSTDLLPLRDRFGIEFPDVDYSIAGKDAGQPAPHIGRLDELCGYDVTRATMLEAWARDRLQPRWRERLARWLRGSAE